MKYTNTITIFIIQYFQQIATRIKSKTDESIVFPVNIFNRAIITRVHKGTANISFTFIVPKGRFLELNVHALYYTTFLGFLIPESMHDTVGTFKQITVLSNPTGKCFVS